MASDAEGGTLSDLARVNPRRHVVKGVIAPFIEMAALPASRRDIAPASIQHRRAKGTGAHFQDGDTLLARITPCLENGKTAQVRGLGAHIVGEGSTEFIVLCGLDPADNDFVYYLCRDPDFRQFAIARMEGTSGRQRVAWQSVAEYPYDPPDMDDRRRAARMLATIDDRINNLRATNATLEAIAQALFKSWFVDFDPVHAKAEGCAPAGMDAASAALFPSEFEDSDLGAIPKGWWPGTLADLADVNASKWTARRRPETVTYIDLSGVTSNRIDSTAEYPFEAAPSRARHHMRDGDTIVGTVRPGNRAFAYIHSPEPNLTGSTGFAVLSPKLARYASYVYLAATGDESIKRLANLADGAAYPAVRPDVVASTPCVIGPDDVIQAFSTVTQPILERIGESRQVIATLTDLRDTLLPRLISGKLRLLEAMEAADTAFA